MNQNIYAVDIIGKRCLVFSAAVLLAIGAAIASDEWSVTSITDNEQTPLAHDCRRPMAAGLYDKAADKTFICFTGAHMQPMVAAYDHAAKTWSTPVGIGVPDRSKDFHDYPHIFQSADGHLHITYSRHNKSLWIGSSQKPHSISGDWHVREIGSKLKATYPMPIKGSDGTLYIHYRVSRSSDYRPMKWVKSTDNGATWSKPVSCIDYKNSRSDHLNEIYVGQLNHEPSHPRFGEGYSASWTLAGGGPERHDHDDYHKNMYYAFFSMSNAHWRAADGADLGTNIDDAEAEAHCLVYDSGELVGHKERGETLDIGYISSSVCDTNGNPIVAFKNGKNNSVDIGAWNGTNWDVTSPATFQGTRGLFDMNRINGKILLLLDEGNGARIVEYRRSKLTEVGHYTPSQNTGDNVFIDDPRPEVTIFSALDTTEIFAVGHSKQIR